MFLVALADDRPGLVGLFLGVACGLALLLGVVVQLRGRLPERLDALFVGFEPRFFLLDELHHVLSIRLERLETVGGIGQRLGAFEFRFQRRDVLTGRFEFGFQRFDPLAVVRYGLDVG